MAAGKKKKGLSGGSISNARNFYYYYYLNMSNLITAFAIKYWLKFSCSMFLIIFVCHYYVCVYNVFLSHLQKKVNNHNARKATIIYLSLTLKRLLLAWIYFRRRQIFEVDLILRMRIIFRGQSITQHEKSTNMFYNPQPST